jgi:D-alanine-D-alanine ligase
MLLVEEYITGREATCAVLEQFRDQSTYVFPVIEIIPPADQPFFTTTAKYNGTTREICPGNFSYTERSKIAELAEFIHQSLGLSQYSRSDFILKNGTPYFLEVNTLPGLTNESLFPKAAAAVGLSFSDLVTHLVETAIN